MFTKTRSTLLVLMGDFFMAQVAAVTRLLFENDQYDLTGAPRTERVASHHIGNSMPYSFRRVWDLQRPTQVL